VHRATSDLTGTDMVLLLDDLEDRQAVLAAQDLVAHSRARFLVLTSCPEGPSWGALLAGGAEALMPVDASLDVVIAAVSVLGDGESPISETTRDRLVREWATWLAEDNDLRARMDRLSARERTVLHLLAGGYRVHEIASELRTAEATVRSQTKSMRRKLGVDSQLAAVALVRRMGGSVGGSPPVLPRPRQAQG
jgi:DNA-binding NarL/FixJ family response regulator